MVYILLCDDDEKVLELTKNYIIKIQPVLKYNIKIITYKDAKSVLKRIKNLKERSDILITDITMPGLSGLELAKIIHNERPGIVLIFLTAHPEYVYKSLEYSPFRYIRKEFMEEELPQALQAACDKINSGKDYISVKVQDGILAIRIKDIIYYELENRKCVIYTIQGRQYKTWKKISGIRSEMGKKDQLFLQVYKGCMVNKYYIKKIKKSSIVLENDKELPASRRKMQEISSIMMDFWGQDI